jgi:tetratricopeptide (TPR) repeat protein
MPARNYMVVDPRRDHSFRVPRPDLSVSIGTPNACNGCHDAETPDWAAAILRDRYGPERAGRFHYGTALHAGRQWRPEAERLLIRVAEESDTPPIVRATALSLLPPYLGPASSPVVVRSLGDADPLVRTAAMEVLDPLLVDPVRTVRMAAAVVLAGIPGSLPTAEDRPLLTAALGEYFDSQQSNFDRSESHMNLGLIHARTGETAMAEAAFRQALTMRPDFVPAWVNLADLYRVLDRDDEGEQILRAGLDHTPDNPEIHHALGLLLVRRGRIDEALDRLRAAYDLRPEPRFGFVYAIALNDTGEAARAMAFLQRAHDTFPGSRDILIGLATIARDRGDLESALTWAGRLRDLQPENTDFLGLVDDLERRIRSRP